MPVTRALADPGYSALNAARLAGAPPPTDYVDVRVLAANTAERHTLPTEANFVSFSANADFYARFGDNTVVAAIAGADVTDGTGSMMNPGIRQLPLAGTPLAEVFTHVSLIAPAATIVTMEFYL